MDLCIEAVQSLVAEGGGGVIEGTDFDVKSTALERQHLGITKSLRNHRIPREQVGETRFGGRDGHADC